MKTQIPDELIKALRGLPGFNETEFISIHEKGEQVTSVRTNPFKPHSQFNSCSPVTWCENGYYLIERPSFTNDPLFHAGAYYVQEASSMFIGHILNSGTDVSKPLRVLDLCAAPGGKSTHLLSILSPGSLLLSNEVIRSRITSLRENIVKWGCPNVIVTNNDPADLSVLENYFDVILVDAPCSGSGLFRKDPEAISEWSEESVKLCSSRQKRILEDVIPSLKKNGILIYSTCSYSEEENEGIVDSLMRDGGFETISLPAEGNTIVRTISPGSKAIGYRFYPGKIKGEGFFAACLRKISGGEDLIIKPRTLKSVTSTEEKLLAKWLHEPMRFVFQKHDDEFFMIRKDHTADLGLLQEHLHIRQAGTRMGKIKNNELIPDHALALSTELDTSCRKVDLTKENALKFLKRIDLKLPGESPGWTLACFEGLPLGWIKILTGRVNNYLPKELRILKQ